MRQPTHSVKTADRPRADETGEDVIVRNLVRIDLIAKFPQDLISPGRFGVQQVSFDNLKSGLPVRIQKISSPSNTKSGGHPIRSRPMILLNALDFCKGTT